MGTFSSKSKTKSSSNQTTTPTTPSWISQPIQDFTGKVSSFANSDPAQYVAGASPLQSQAFAGAANLGPNQTFNDAIDMAKTAGAAPASTYSAPTLGAAQTVNLSGYNAPTLGAATHANSESLMDGFNRYLDPSTKQLVDATLRNYDAQSGKSAAALQAQQARTGAFGGSRAGIAQGEFAASTDRQRAMTEGELRARAFSQAAQMADSDAGRRQNTGFFNAGADNTRTLAQGGFDADAARYGADARNQGSIFNAGAQNQFALSQAGFDASAGQFNASAEEAARNRALQAAGLVGNLGVAQSGDARANVAMQGELGAMERAIQQAQLNAPLTQLQAAGQLYGAIPYPAFVGQNTTGTSTSTTKNSPGVGSIIGAGLAGWASGGFGMPSFG